MTTKPSYILSLEVCFKRFSTQRVKHDQHGNKIRRWMNKAYIILSSDVTNGLYHQFHLDESTFISRGIDFIFIFYFIFDKKKKSCKQTEQLHILFEYDHKKDAMHFVFKV